MVKVRYFGLIRLNIKESSDEIEAANLEDLIRKISLKYGMDIDELRDSVIFVNETNMMQLRGLKTELKDGDEVQMFSPVAGG